MITLFWSEIPGGVPPIPPGQGPSHAFAWVFFPQSQSSVSFQPLSTRSLKNSRQQTYKRLHITALYWQSNRFFTIHTVACLQQFSNCDIYRVCQGSWRSWTMKLNSNFSPFLLLCSNHLLLKFTKNLRRKPLASMRPHTHADKLDHFIHKK